jgi:hypothetical protein
MQNSGVFSGLSDQIRKAIIDFTQKGLDELDPTHKKVFKKKTTTHKFERITTTAPFGDVPAKAEGADYSYDIIQPGYTKDITPREYGLGYLYTETAEEDDEYGVISSHSRWLGFSTRILQETLGATVLNNAFTSQTSADGVALCSTSHTLKRGGTVKNRLSTDSDPSMAAFAQMRSDMRTNTKLESGQLVRPARKVYLIHHPDQEWLVHRLVKSKLLPESANNDTNPANDLMDIMPLAWEYLTDADAWFMLAQNSSTHGLIQVQRKAPTVNPPRQDAKSGNWIVSIRLRDTFDSWDWRNLAGTPGA